MDFLFYFQLSLIEIFFIIFTVFIASIIRGFNGFGFSATCISLISFILPKYTKNIGTGIVSTIYSISVFTFILNCHYFNPLISIGYNSYLLLTEMLLPSQIISKTLINGGA